MSGSADYGVTAGTCADAAATAATCVPVAGSWAVATADSCTSTMVTGGATATSDATNCVLTSGDADFDATTAGSCAGTDTDIATCAYVAGVYAVTLETCTSTTVIDAATTCALTPVSADVTEGCDMTLATGVVEEETGAPTVCTLVPVDTANSVVGSCTVSGGGTTPGTCAYRTAAAAVAGSCAVTAGTGTCDYAPPATSCGYATVVELVADSASWPAPSWFSGTPTIDTTMDSPLECQARCLNNAACDYFSYEWEYTTNGMFHECYLKASYADAECMVNPYVTWASQDTQWHGQSGPGIACASTTELELACGGQVGMDYGGNPSYGGPEGCSSTDGGTCVLTAATGDVTEGCVMTLATGIVEEETTAPTVCALTAAVATAGTAGSCTASGGGTTPGTCTYRAAATAAVGTCAVTAGTGTCDYAPPATSCGYASVLTIYADHQDWTPPGWFGGQVVFDAGMASPADCQAACLMRSGCDYFSYEWEFTTQGMYHECYLKASYADAQCMVNPYVPWASQDPQWHGQSGPKSCDTVVTATVTAMDATATTAATTAVTDAFTAASTAAATVVITASATFTTDFSTIVVDDFKAEFATAMAASLGVGLTADKIVVDSVVTGSVVVTWHFLAPLGVASEAASLVVSVTPPSVGGDAAVIATPTVTEGPLTTLSGSGSLAAPVDCVGSWTATCDAACARTWTETTAVAGLGAVCPAADACPPGTDLCPALCAVNQNVASNVCADCATGFTNAAGDNPSAADTTCTVTPVDCTGSFGTCDAACARAWTETTPVAGLGAACPAAATAAACPAGTDLCPAAVTAPEAPPPPVSGAATVSVFVSLTVALMALH